MTTHGPFPIDEQDLHFVLFEHLKVHELFGREAFGEVGREDAEMILKEGWKFAREKVWPTNAILDREGVRWEGGGVTTTETMHKLHAQYREAGWSALTADEAYGGANLPASFGMGLGEPMVGANMSYSSYPGLARGVARVIENHGTDEQKKLYVEKLYSGEWGGTMCLTEAHAGTAVGDLRTTATPEGDRYIIRGTKIFITGGDQDLTDNIIHLVLARTPGAPAGIKGVSLFIVPKVRLNDDGSLGESNDVACVGIEHKLGIHASSTCQLSFGDNDSSEGWLIGEENRGIQVMFQLMNEARIGTGLHGLANGAVAYQWARDYAKERVQGVEIDQMRDVDAPRVTIDRHPDVKRMLFTMKARVEGMRALLFKAAHLADDAESNPDADAAARAHKLLELLTPLCKSHCSDVGFDVCVMAMQTLGGAGYTQDHPVEQCLRDAKIASIYEGANGIQALDLIGRKLSKNMGELFMLLCGEIDGTCERLASHAALEVAVARTKSALEDVQRVAGHLAALGMGGDVKGAALGASAFLTMLSQLVTSWLLLEQAEIAHASLEGLCADSGIDGEGRAAFVEENDRARFYDRKIHTARFYAQQLLPENVGLAASIEDGYADILDVTL
jgi:alkylation response protein AidB-like acyl-CoA dehydrogenase